VNASFTHMRSSRWSNLLPDPGLDSFLGASSIGIGKAAAC
jgi:hypothetical protein